MDNQKKNAQIKELIAKLYNKKTDRGISASVETTIEINTLKSLLRIKVSDSQIIKTIVYTPITSDSSVEEFEKKIQLVQNKENEDDKKTEWQIFIPLTLKLPKQRIIIYDQIYKTVNKEDLAKYKIVDFFRHTIFNDIFLEPKTMPDDPKSYLEVSSFGRDFYVAWNNIQPSFNILRGIVDYIITTGYWTYNSGLKCRSIVPHPKYVFGLSNKESKRYLEFMVNPGWNHKKDISKEQKVNFNRLLKAVEHRPKDNSIQALISDSFRIYSNGMDELAVEFSFLRFWQLAERICFPYKEKTNKDDITTRLNYFSKTYFIDKLDPYILSLKEKRNELVHHGIDHITEDDLNFVKTLCEKIIQWIVTYKDTIKTKKHLDLFLRSRDISDADLFATQNILTFIKKYRDKK
jgi:hypothetical protein